MRGRQHPGVKIGALVRSGYRAPWTGLVLDLEHRKGMSDLATVHVTHDRHGKPLRKPQRHILSAWYLTPIERSNP